MSAESALRDGNAAGFELIETMRWEPRTGFVRFDRHLARLYASARELGFAYDPQRIGEALKDAITDPAQAAAHASRPVGRTATCTASTQPYEPLPPHKVWTPADRPRPARFAATRCCATRPAGARST